MARSTRLRLTAGTTLAIVAMGSLVAVADDTSASGASVHGVLTHHGPQTHRPRSHDPHGPKPTVVLVHGAWADSGSWDGVTARLLRDGYPVRVFATPLETLSGDAAALHALLATIPGQVVLVGHSYGGAVITEAAVDAPNVESLVYVDAFAPDEGQAVSSLAGADSALANPDLTQVFDFVPQAPPTGTTELYLKTSVFIAAVANDLPRRQAEVLAAAQRPATLAAFSEAATTPAWATIPSWYEVGTIDKVITPQAQLDMAHHAGAHIVRARTGHLPMVSAPGTVTRTIEEAACS